MQIHERLHGFKSLDYKTRLLKLGLDSLEMRRLKQDLIYTYKLLFGHVIVDANDFLFCRHLYIHRLHVVINLNYFLDVLA